MAGLAYALNGRLAWTNVTIKTSAGDVTMVNEGVVVVKKTVGAATQVTLPPSPSSGGQYPAVLVIDGTGDAATNNITVVASSGNINGAANHVISENYGSVLYFYNGTEWQVMSQALSIAAAELALLNGVTAGTGLASKVMSLDASKDYFGPDAGGIVVGHTAQLTVAGVVPELQVLGTTTAVDGSAAFVTASTTNSAETQIVLGKVGNAALGSFTTVAQSENLGSIAWVGDDGTDLATVAARIRAVVNASGTVAASRVPTDLVFYVDPGGSDDAIAEKLRLTCNGDLQVANGGGVVIGNTAQVAVGAVTSELQVQGTAPADSTISLTAWSADAVPPRLYFGKSRSATIGTFSIITTGDNLGEIMAFGDDGVDLNSNSNASAGIVFDSAGTIAADRVPGVIRFQTATDAAPSVLTTALTIDQAQTVTCAAGLVTQTATAAAITTTRSLTAADSGGVFSVAKTSAYAITLPTPAQGLKFKFMVLDTGANAVTISNGSAHLYGVVSVANAATAMTGTTLSLASAGSVGDWVEFEGIDATHYLVTGACIAAADITIA